MRTLYSILSLAIRKTLAITGRDKRYIDKFSSRYPSFTSFYPEILNYFYFSINSTRSFKPIAIIIEPLNKCNLSCIQCEVNRGMRRPKGQMELSMLKRIIDNHPFLQRINLTNYGEPLLHKDIIEMIAYIHKSGKFVNIITNATLLTEAISQKLINAGLNMITFSMDGVDKTYEKVRGYDYSKVEHNIKNFLKINKLSSVPIRTEMNMVEFEPTMGQADELIKRWGNDIDLITTAQLRNTSKRAQKCLILWRSLTVLWDGTVVPCCIDVEGSLPVGNIKEKKLEEIFNDTPIKKLRKLHIEGKFPPICSTCNEFFG